MLATVSEITEPRDIYSKLFFSVVDEEVSLVVSRQVLIDIVEKLKSLPDEQAISAAKCLLVRIQPRVISFEEQVSGAEVLIRKLANVLLEWPYMCANDSSRKTSPHWNMNKTWLGTRGRIQEELTVQLHVTYLQLHNLSSFFNAKRRSHISTACLLSFIPNCVSHIFGCRLRKFECC